MSAPAAAPEQALSAAAPAAVPAAPRLPADAVLDLLARASSPAERIAGGWLRPAGDPAVAEQRRDRWMTRIADGDPARAAEIATEQGRRLEQWRTGLGHVTAMPGAAQPRWVGDAQTLLAMIGTEPDLGSGPVPRLRDVAGEGLPDWVDPDQPWRFHAGFRDWSATARRDVDRWCAGAPVSVAAREQLVLDLARRMLGVSGPLLMEAAAGRPANHPLFGTDARADWELLWLTHPVVARLLATTWAQWRAATAELCGRIAADLPVITPGTEVRWIGLSAGDQHGRGRGVARLLLSDASTVFLKPRADGLHRVLGAVLDRVDACGPPLGLTLPVIIEREGYTWARQVHPGDCADDAAVAAYFYRAGALLRIVQATGATDLHHENFVPTPELPVLVDLETAVAPGPLSTAPADDAISIRLADTPGPTSMVTSVVAGAPGRSTADLGALAGPSTSLTPYAVRTLILGAAGPELCNSRAPLVNGTALPTRSGRPVALRGYEDALLDGYREAHRRLATLVGSEPFADLGPGAAVRVVVRPTRTYARLLAASTAPGALVDGVDRELVLDLLYRATGTAPAGLIACEVEAMRELDVPLFTAPFAGTDLHADRGTDPTRVLPEVLVESAQRRTTDRWRRTRDADDVEADLRATVFSMDPHEHGGVRAPRPAPVVDPAAVLLRGAIELGDGTLGWIGLEHDPNRNRWTYGRLTPGLAGQAGVGLALAVAATAPLDHSADTASVSPTSRDEYAAAARAALLGSVARVGSGATGPADAFGGPAGVLYATAFAARLLDDAELRAAARTLIRPALRAAGRREPSLTIDGAAGAILALHQLPDDRAVPETLAELVGLLDPEEQRDPAVQADDAPDPWTRSLPTRAYGTALARHRSCGPGRPSTPVPTPVSSTVSTAAGLRTLLDQAHLAVTALRHGPDPAWAAHLDRIRSVLIERRARTGRWADPLLAPDATLPCALHGLAALVLVLSADGSEPASGVPIVRVLS